MAIVLKPGQLILNGSYRIEKELGHGAFGEVYLATYLPLDILRAIKVVQKGRGLGSTEFELYRDRFRVEARLGASLHHPNIIRVLQFEEVNNKLFLIMDYAPNGSLADQIRQAQETEVPIQLEKALKWMRQAASGLGELHIHDYIHRDVKPSNILLDAGENACIADLGLVQLPTSRLGGSSLNLNHPGTPEYMPVEQQPGNNMPLRVSADVYALGCVFFELLTGKQYYHRPEGATVRSIRKEVPAWLDEIVTKALRLHSKDRFQNMEEFLKSLENGESKTKKEYKQAKQDLVFANPRRKFIILGTAIVGLIIIGLVMSNLWIKIYRTTGKVVSEISTPVINHKNTMSIPELTSTSWLGGLLGPGTQVSTKSISLTQEPTQTSLLGDLLGPGTPIPAPTNTPVPTRTPELTIGSSTISPIDGMKLMYVPAGEFLMGSTDGVGDPDEHPQHSVYLDSFWIDTTEVTNSMYSKCVQVKACIEPSHKSASETRPSYYGNPLYDDYPVIFVKWDQANNYCKWAGRSLPSEAQWEKAARGTDGQIFPWGDQIPDASLANNNQQNTTKVGSFKAGASPYGALDMAGNVWELVMDWYDESFYQISPRSNPQGPDTGYYHVIRGGAWNFNLSIDRTTNRAGMALSDNNYYTGFRCSLNESVTP